jgi:hypothetical protein
MWLWDYEIMRLWDLILFSRELFPAQGPEFHMNPYIAQIELELNENENDEFGFESTPCMGSSKPIVSKS